MKAPHPLPPIIMSGSLNILAGAPGCGKTALTAQLLKDFRDTTPVFGRKPTHLPGLGIIATDRSWDSTGQWFDIVGFPEIRYYSLIDDDDFNPRVQLQRHNRTDLLKQSLGRLRLPAGSLVVIDPIALFLGSDLNSYDICATHCIEIRRLAVERSLTFIGITHSGKQKTDKKERYLRLQDRTLGSTAILGYCDTQMYLASPEEMDQPYYGLLVQSHHAKGETFFLDRDDHGRFIPYSPNSHEKEYAPILQLFPDAGDPISFGDLVTRAAGIGVSRTTLYRALKQLAETGIVTNLAHGIWSKPRAN